MLYGGPDVWRGHRGDDCVAGVSQVAGQQWPVGLRRINQHHMVRQACRGAIRQQPAKLLQEYLTGLREKDPLIAAEVQRNFY